MGVGSISGFWGSLTESILLTVFVLPEFHGQGMGSYIIDTLESDELVPYCQILLTVGFMLCQILLVEFLLLE